MTAKALDFSQKYTVIANFLLRPTAECGKYTVYLVGLEHPGPQVIQVLD